MNFVENSEHFDHVHLEEINPQQEPLSVAPGRELLDSVNKNTLKYGYGRLPSQLFLDVRVQQFKNPQTPVVLLASALPARGKTFLEEQGITYAFSDEAIGDIEEQYGVEVPSVTDLLEFNLPWGDAFEGRRLTGDENDDDYRKLKAQEAESTAKRWGDGLASTIKTAQALYEQGETRPILIKASLPVLAGIYTQDGKEIGRPRGVNEVRELVHHDGRFQGLTYNDLHLGIYASKEVFNRALMNRQGMLEIDSVIGKKEILEKRGVYIDFNDPKELATFLGDEQSAKPNEVLQIEKQAFEVIRHLTQHDETFQQRNLMEFDEFISDSPRAHSQFRNIHAIYIQWFMQKYLQVPEDKIALAANEEIVNEIHIGESEIDIERHRPLRENM